MDRKAALCYHVNPIILLVIDPCLTPLWPGLLLHPYGWLTRQLRALAAQVPYASFRHMGPTRGAMSSQEDCPFQSYAPPSKSNTTTELLS